MIDAKGYGERIRRALFAHISQIGRRYSYAEFARDVGKLERGKKYSQSAPSEWIQERSEPSVATFLAIAKVLGTTASWLAFGEQHEVRVYTKVPDLPHEAEAPTSRAVAEGGRKRRPR